MSEKLEERLVTGLQHAMAPQLADAECLLMSPEVDTFLNCTFADNPLTLRKPLTFFEGSQILQQARASGNTVELGAAICSALQVAEESRQDMMEGYSTDVEADSPEAETIRWQTAVRWLKQGPDKILRKALSKGEQYDYAQETYINALANAYEMLFPLSLTLLAVDALEVENQDYAKSMAQFKRDAVAVQAGRKFNTKAGDPRQEAYARALNLLREYYHKAKDPNFIKRFTSQQKGEIVDYYEVGQLTELELQGSSSISEAQSVYARSQRFIADKLVEMGRPFGLGHVNFNFYLRAEDVYKLPKNFQLPKSKRKARQAMRDPLATLYASIGSTDQGVIKQPRSETPQEYWTQRIKFLTESQRILTTRKLIDAAADGTLDLRTVLKTNDLLKSRPLLPEDKPFMAPEELVEWEVLPSEVTGFEHDGGEDVAESTALPAGVDMARIAALREYIRLWGDGRIARSRIPNLPEDDQYYLAILPQKVGKTVLEHAVGDNPSTGQHAVYVWRAEKGLGKLGQVQQTWREVFRQYKSVAKKLGAKSIYHTATLDQKVLDYLTRRVADLDSPRYFFK